MYKDYFELKAVEKQQTQEEFVTLPHLPKRRMSISLYEGLPPPPSILVKQTSSPETLTKKLLKNPLSSISVSQASLVAQMVKNLPMIWETWVQPLGWEDPLEKGMAIYSSILAWRIPWTEEHLPYIGLVKKFIWEFKNLKKNVWPTQYIPSQNFPCLEAQHFDLCLVTSSQFAGLRYRI